MNADLYSLYMKRLREEETTPQEQPQEKKGFIQKGKDFVKKHAGKLAAGVAGAALVGGAIMGANGKKVTPEELQQQNMQLQQTLDNNLKMDVASLMHKAQTGNTPYSKRIFIATQPLSDNDNQVNARNQPGIKKEGGGILSTVGNAVKGFVGL